MLVFKRTIENQILTSLEKRGLTIILGPRQSGKTTLVKNILAGLGKTGSYFNCELADVRKHFVLGDPTPLRDLIGERDLVVFDEAQTIENIGKIFKLFHDTYPDIKIIATGSSSFDLANKIREPLTGRADEFMLYPLSLQEIASVFTLTRELLDILIRYGCYPAVVAAGSDEERETQVKRVATNYLYKDIFTFEALRNPKAFENLVTCLATRTGGIVHTANVAKDAGMAPKTAEAYMHLLEQAFVIKRIYSFSRNYANELKKSYKVHFLDVGIRNVFSGESLREPSQAQQGARFESFLFSEFAKRDTLMPFPPRTHFWRTTDKKEIDFVRVEGEAIHAYEAKIATDDVTFTTFLKRYPNATTHLVTPDSLLPHCTIPHVL